ncbi:MAG TPA: FAD-dependent oxidoreductase, partial [Candidatus Saccharimonadales bacterium]|nr:FAD-dependent oxidoreductase [Candidatus Saccharimonadales bacterium]
AAAAAAAGARTALVNDGELGGLCILRGCMPSKTLLHSSHVLHEMRTAGRLGVHTGEIRVDVPAIYRRKDEKVARFQRAKIRSIESSPYDVIEGRGRFTGPATLAVGDRLFGAGGYVIATGSRPAPSPVPGSGDVRVLSSDDLIGMGALPRSLVVHGAGAIGLELGQFLARMGVEVLIVGRSRPLSKVDRDCSDEMMQVLRDEPGLDGVMPGRILGVRKDGDGILFDIEGNGVRRVHRAEAFLSAIGRVPDVAGLGLDRAGVRVRDGGILHEPSMRTTNPAIYVAGDATGSFQVLHLANQEGAVAGHNAARGVPERHMDYRLRMWIVFTDPPFASIGLTEDEARREGRAIVSAVKRFPEQGRAITMETDHGLLKVIARAASGEILGAHILGPRADDLVHIIAAVMFYRGRAADLCAMPWYHPTLSEALIEIGRNLAALLDGRPPVESPPA